MGGEHNERPPQPRSCGGAGMRDGESEAGGAGPAGIGLLGGRGGIVGCWGSPPGPAAIFVRGAPGPRGGLGLRSRG